MRAAAENFVDPRPDEPWEEEWMDEAQVLMMKIRSSYYYSLMQLRWLLWETAWASMVEEQKH
jgi:hypothetical protein